MEDAFLVLEYEPALKMLCTKLDYLPIEIWVPVFLAIVLELYGSPAEPGH